ncbi:MAG: malto-oligosyltrehalose synthase [Candidatus Velthaea sp.]
MVDRLTQRPPTVPTATYRLQFTPVFGFRDATAIVPYLNDLGVGHLYASPYLKARPGSLHGYDVVDPNALNPEIGTPAEHAAMVSAAQAKGMGQILDFVPNHMGIGPDNPWWNDVLEWGERSTYAAFFDIDWRPLKPELQGKVLVPTLGDHYGRVLESGEIKLSFELAAGTFVVDYFDNRFPVAVKSYADVLQRAAHHGAPQLEALAAEFASFAPGALPATAAEMQPVYRRAAEVKKQLADAARDAAAAVAIARALEDFTIVPGDPRSADALDLLLSDQFYRLAYWRVAVDDVNYRRFFDINDLAGLRVEDAAVLGQTHRLAFAWIAAGTLQGLRIDHIDGLYNPGGYCNLIKERSDALGQPLYVVVEKILAPFERLRASWLISGTTGYEFANLVNGLFVDAGAEAGFDRIYARAIGHEPDYDLIAYEAKRRIMSINLASELTVLATNLSRIAASDRRSSDFTFNGLRDALIEVVAAFPVYRTYVVSEEIEAEDREFIEAAVAVAQLRSTLADESVFAFIADVLTVRAAEPNTGYDRNEVLRFAMRFQQYTSPVMAKSIEDTVFYRYVRLISLNEVGGDPTRFGTSVGEFHAANAERAATRPHTMLATSTHDHKRGEDVRTRIDVLTEMPGGWSRALRRWSRINRTRRETVRGHLVPDPNDEYFLYQTLVGTWPAAWHTPAEADAGEYAAYVERIVAYFEKAQREAKTRTSWANPDLAYEEGTARFIRTILERGDEARFPNEIGALVAEIAPAAMVSSLSQLVFKCTAPGVPDIYQGCELWDHSLVDPDNRRPVDYVLRAAMLAEAKIDPAAARASWLDGRVKLYVTSKLLELRAQRRATFLDGPYMPLDVVGVHSEHVIAFARTDVIVIAPRLVRTLVRSDEPIPRLAFGDETVSLPPDTPTRLRDIFTEARIEATDGRIAVSTALEAFPVSVLVPD